MDRVLYEIDPFNRLIVRNFPGKLSKVKKFRKVIYGRFRTDGNNTLFYEANKSQGMDIPQKIRFSGKYSLDKNHNFIVTLNKWNNQCEGNRFTLKTRIVDAKSNEILFMVNSRSMENKSLTYIMKLYGSWQADKENRLTFGVERDGSALDHLTLSGAWEVNKNNEISYRRFKDSQIITFKGHWDIAGKCRLRYILDKKTDSGFNFRSSIGTLAPRDREIYATFDVGIALGGAKIKRRRIIFSGRLKIGKGREFILETSNIEVGGLNLKFTKEMFDRRGIAYIESIVRDKERFIGSGVIFKW